MKKLCFFSLLISLFTIATACMNRTDKSVNKKKVANDTITPPKKGFTLADFYSQDTVLDKLTDSIFQRITRAEKIGQTIVMFGGKGGHSVDKLQTYIKKYKIGGVTLLKGSKTELKSIAHQVRRFTETLAQVPLLISADGEPSLINQKITGLPSVPYADKISHPAVSEAVGIQIAQLLQEIGIHHNYAPVCDFSENKAIIDRRSFGNNVEKVTLLTEAFIKGLQKNGIVATAKHFPGQGTVEGDTHKKPVYISDTLPELPIFQNAVDNGVISIMTGHIEVRNHSSWSSNGKPATLSPKLINELLKDSLGFEGLVVSDAMNMAAVSTFPTPAFTALKAGCDMVLDPANPEGYVNRVMRRAANNPDFEKRLARSVKRIIRLKICLGLISI